MSKILLVEFEPSLRGVLTDWLKSEDYEVIPVASGKQALEQAEQNAPDLVLLDLSLPEEGGLAVISKLKQGPGTANVPIIALADLGGEYSRKRAQEAGAVDFITKADNNLEQVSKIIKRALGQ